MLSKRKVKVPRAGKIIKDTSVPTIRSTIKPPKQAKTEDSVLAPEGACLPLQSL